MSEIPLLERWFSMVGMLGITEPGYRMGSAGSLCGSIRDVMDLDLDDRAVLDADFGGRIINSCKQRIIEAQGYEDFTTENVLTTADGTSQAIFLTFKALLERGDEVIVTAPAWPQFVEWREEEKRYVPLPLSQTEGVVGKILHRRFEEGWRYPLEDLKEQVSTKTKLIVVQSPGHNPTGKTTKADEMRAICEIAEDCGAYILHDEIFRGLEHDAPYSTPVAVNLYDKSVCVSSLSKTIGLEGLRLGWIASRDKDLIRKCAGLSHWSGQMVRQRFALMVVDSALEPERYKRLLEEKRGIMERSWYVVFQWMHKHRDAFDWVPPEAAYLSFPRLKLDIDAWSFCEKLLKEKRTMLVPGTCYGFNNHIRFGVGKTTTDKVIMGLRKIEEFLETLE